MKIEKAHTERRYIISQKEIKEAFGLKGNIESITLWAGQSPFEREQGRSKDNVTYEFILKEALK